MGLILSSVCFISADDRCLSIRVAFHFVVGLLFFERRGIVVCVCVGRCCSFDVMICRGFGFGFRLFYFCGGPLSFKWMGLLFCCGPVVFQGEGIVVCVRFGRC